MNFSTKFKSSVNPRKQRLYVYHAPLHIKSAMLASHLSKELRQKTGKRSMRVRVGDKVVIMLGQHRKKTGKVEGVSVSRLVVFVSGVDRQRKDGSKAAYPVHPSNLVIVEMVEDKRRVNKVRKAPVVKSESQSPKATPKAQTKAPTVTPASGHATKQKKGSQ